jgi:pyrroloquinoline-quinone synthase
MTLLLTSEETVLLTPDELEATLRAHAKQYHSEHPFHRRMNEGQSSPEEIRGWVANRFYYQLNIPRKDGAILSNCPDREVRRRWVHRITDHDGTTEGTGGIESWLRLSEAVGLTREEVENSQHLLPSVRFAVDAYVTFTRTRPWVEAVASSLTELFAPNLMTARLAAFERHYTWIDPEGLAYFRTRITQAPLDSEHGLAIVRKHCVTPETQAAAVAALSFKCDVLWSMLEAIDQGYGTH